MLGGFKGYSGGRDIRPWYTPPSKSESAGPLTEKCHSNKLSSTGWAKYSAVGWDSSWASLINLFTALQWKMLILVKTVMQQLQIQWIKTLTKPHLFLQRKLFGALSASIDTNRFTVSSVDRSDVIVVAVVGRVVASVDGRSAEGDLQLWRVRRRSKASAQNCRPVLIFVDRFFKPWKKKSETLQHNKVLLTV